MTIIKAPTTQKKRGRPGNKIYNAFKAIPTNRVDFETYCQKHELEPSSMRQVKRHDPFPETGQVRVLKNPKTHKIEIWREKPANI